MEEKGRFYLSYRAGKDFPWGVYGPNGLVSVFSTKIMAKRKLRQLNRLVRNGIDIRYGI